MFEITPDDIALFNDSDLRALVGLLAETQMRNQGLPTASVTWGGNQDAGDGGIDVRVALPKGKPIQGFVPKRKTGFQVKKPDMPPAQITKEMRPKGKLRQVIRELAVEGGAYIIVSSGVSVSDSALRKRRDTMAAALKGIKGARNVTLDYYDRRRLSTWLRDYPGLIPWAREKIGKPIRGWQSYGAWAYPPEGPDAKYLVDEKTQIQTGKSEDDAGLKVIAGIERMRKTLAQPRNVVRFVGLSGFGKTRLVQALFDSRIGKGGLNPSQAIYTNMSDDPNPQPIGLASDLIASKTCAILVVDNCPLDLHRRLSEICRRPESLVSVITVEYDIRDDEPEETEVFRIDSSSLDLIEKLVKKRFPQVSMVDAGTIAKFSGGNARIAIALAGTVGKGDKLTGLTDEDLFTRLFQQRHEHDADLLLVAQACSLVYSFQGEAVDGAEAELPVIAALTGKTVAQVHAAVAELKRRDLVQQRGVWRAVLPHALANRLAKMALQNIPTAEIDKHLVQGASERLLRSFSRRLCYLHDSKEVVHIVEGWLGKDGLLGDLATLTELGRNILSNIAPVIPASVLAALERTPSGYIAGHDGIVRLIRSLAYEAKYFDRCVELLAKFAEIEAAKEEKSDAASCLGSLFHIVLSGTLAPPAQRLQSLEALLTSSNPIRQALGLKAFSAFLESSHFSSSYAFEFGAHSRDHGYTPRTGKDVQTWFSSVLKLFEQLDAQKLSVGKELRETLSQHFRALWSNSGVTDELDRIFRAIAKEGFWREGWAATRQTLKFDGKGMPKKVRDKLTLLEKALRPAKLVENVRGIVLGGSSGSIDLEDVDLDEADYAAAHERQEALAFNLGKDSAQSPKELAELLPELVTGQGRLWAFGRGLAAGSADIHATWKALTEAFKVVGPKDRRTQVLGGFLNGLNEHDPDVANNLLDAALSDPALGAEFPALQSSVVIDGKGVTRFKECLKLGIASARDFYALVGGRASDPIPGKDLRELLNGIASKPDGSDVALEILYMRLFSDRDQKKAAVPEVVETGRDLLEKIDFKKDGQRHDHRLASIVRACLTGDGAGKAFTAVCENFKKVVADNTVYAFHYDDFVQSLFTARPVDALDNFLGGDEANRKLGTTIILDTMRHGKSIQFVIADDIIRWCEQDPGERYLLVANVVPPFKTETEKTALEWNPTVLALLDRSPNPVAFLKQLVQRFAPMSWSGSRAAIMESRLPLLKQLESHANPRIAEVAREEGLRIQQQVEKERKWETENDRSTDERFE